VCLGKPGGRRTSGRPKLRWLNGVENDLKWMSVVGWGREQKTFVWVIIPKEALVELYGQYTSEE
jgi:hypothetical protein